MSLLKTNEIQNYNGSSLTLTASTVSTSAQLNTGGNISVTGSLNVSDDSTTRTNLGLGTIATQDSNNVNLTGGTIGSSVVFPAGHVIQVFGKNGLTGSDLSTTSSTLIDISNSASTDTLSVQFNTKQANSKFLILLNANILLNSGEGAGLGIHFNDGTTNTDVYETDANQLTASIPSGDIYQSLFNQFLYTSTTPANTSVTITGRIKSYLGSSIIIEVNENKGTSISVMEIAG